VLHNLASARLEAAEELEPSAFRSLLADVTRALSLLDLQPVSEWLERVRATMEGTRAELHRRLGEGEEASEALREADRRAGGPGAQRLVIEGRLAQDAGRLGDARRHFTAACTLAHPQSRVFAKASARLAALGPPP
jgi:hypothetical protein